MQGLTPLGRGRYRFRLHIGGTKQGRRIQCTWGAKEPISRDEAVRRAMELLQRYGVNGREATSATDYTVAELAAEVLQLRATEFAPSWLDRLNGIFENHIGPFLGTKKVSKLTPADLARYRDARLRETYSRGTTKEQRRVSGATFNRERAALLMVLNHAVALGLLKTNPLPHRSTKPLPEAPKTFWFSDEEWARFLAAFDDFEGWKRVTRTRAPKLGPVKVGLLSPKPRRYGGGRVPTEEELRTSFARWRVYRDYFEAVLLLAGRLQEAMELRWSTVYLDEKVLRMRQKKTERGKPEHEWKKVVITEKLKALLERQRRGAGEAHVFRQFNGSPLRREGVQKAFALARKISGVRRELTVHSIRHTVGFQIVRAGFSEKVAQEVLGHKSTVSTRRYIHAAETHIAAAFEAIGRAEPSASTETSSGHRGEGRSSAADAASPTAT